VKHSTSGIFDVRVVLQPSEEAVQPPHPPQRPRTDLEKAAEAIRYVDRLEKGGRPSEMRRERGSFVDWLARWYPKSA
jgi:hypothetical protein